MFRAVRIFVLLFILLAVALSAWRMQTRSVEWKYTLPVNVYPINADGSQVSADYIKTLRAEAFKPIENFMRDEAARYGRASNASIEIRLRPKIDTLPPEPPHNGSTLDVIGWSLKTRWWAYRKANETGPGPQVKLFVLYFDPALRNRLGHSTGLQKGLIGVVNAFASDQMAKENNVVIAHEFLHTLGATDKYDPATNQPLYPDGYAEPDLKPLHPQTLAEIMAGRVALSQARAETPRSLDFTVIGRKTAQEINWVQ